MFQFMIRDPHSKFSTPKFRAEFLFHMMELFYVEPEPPEPLNIWMLKRVKPAPVETVEDRLFLTWPKKTKGYRQRYRARR